MGVGVVGGVEDEPDVTASGQPVVLSQPELAMVSRVVHVEFVQPLTHRVAALAADVQPCGRRVADRSEDLSEVGRDVRVDAAGVEEIHRPTLELDGR